MTRPRGLEALLLVLVAASVFLGGGIGCVPDLDGVSLRGSTFDDESYVAFYGKKAPGNGWAVLRYPIVPTAEIRATVGVVNPRYLQASIGAEGCVGIQQSTLAYNWQLCATYLSGPTTRISSSLSGDTFDCPTATGALLRLADDGDDVSALYTCPGGIETELESVPSQWNVGEKWFLTFGGYGLGKGAEVGYRGLHYVSDGPFEASVDGNIAFANFDALRHGMEAFYLFDANDFGGGITEAFTAGGALQFALDTTRDQGAFPDTDVEKDLSKAYKSYVKTVDKLFPDKFSGYLKAFPKIAEEEACALDEEEDFF